jgi:hypothetical protein
MPRLARERPRRAALAAVGVAALLALGWVAGAGAADPAAVRRPEAATLIPQLTATVTRTVTVTQIETSMPGKRRSLEGTQRHRTGHRRKARINRRR